MGTETRPRLKEAEIQRAIVDYLSLISKQYRFLFFAVPNEALGRGGVDRSQNARRIRYLKTLGLTPGVSDLIIGHRGRMLCLEVKRPGEKQSENQEQFERWSRGCGIPYCVVTSVDDTKKTLLTFLRPAD